MPIWVGMAVYVLFGVTTGLFHGYKAAYFEAYVPMFLAPFIVNAVVVARPPVKMLWLGAATAAVLAGLVGSYQSLYLLMGRAGGAMNNVIMFGDLAVVLAMALAPLLQAGAMRRGTAWVVPAALLLFAVFRLPSGNLWDAVLDPWLWLVLHIVAVRGWVRRKGA